MMVKIEIHAEDLACILDALKSGAARLKGIRCEFTDKLQIHAMNSAYSTLKEAAESAEEQE